MVGAQSVADDRQMSGGSGEMKRHDDRYLSVKSGAECGASAIITAQRVRARASWGSDRADQYAYARQGFRLLGSGQSRLAGHIARALVGF